MANKLWSAVQKGAYAGGTAYTVGDFVTYNGSSYTCILNSTGNLPTNATYWALISSIGATGATGSTGATGATGATGPIGITWLGAYNGATSYVVNNGVSYSGSSYICILNSTGNLPTNGTYWNVVASKGTDGVGSGTVTNTGGNLTANAVMLGAGVVDSKVVAGITTDGTSIVNLGVNATTAGKVKLFGGTSGDVTIAPTAAAGTATVQTLPATTGTLVNRVTTGNGVSASNTDGALAFTLGAITPSTVNGNTLTTGTYTLTGTAAKTLNFTNTLTLSGTDSTTMTFPSTSSTVMTIASADTVAGVKTFNDGTVKLSGLTSGASTLKAPAIASTYVHTLPAQTTTLDSYAETTEASNATPTVAIGGLHHTHTITALAVAAAFAAPTIASGSLIDSNQLIIRIKDNATARALTWNAIFRASSDLALPATTVLSKTLYCGFKYNVADTKWDLLAVLNNI